MRVAALYDVHGNLPALEAALEAARAEGVDRLVVGGDVVPGPQPRETVAALLALELPVDFVRGNGEREVLAMRAGGDVGAAVPEAFHPVLRWVASELDDAQAEALAGWPASVRLQIPGLGRVLFCHATPRSDVEIFTRETPEDEARPAFADVEADLVVCGHTHMAFDRTIGGVRVVNAGSVGMPFGAPGACWALLGPAGPELRRTGYDLEAAAARVRASAYPQAEQFAARSLLAPPGEDEMIRLFERSPLRVGAAAGG